MNVKKEGGRTMMQGAGACHDKDRAMIERYNEVIGECGHLTYFPLVVEKYEGAVITDIDGNEYIDFLSSASSMNLGGSHPAIMKAVREQLEKVSQYATAYTFNAPMVEYAERITSVYPGGVRAKVAYGHSGSDSNDGAVKIVRAYTGRDKIITFSNAYHGSTYGASSMTTVTSRMRSGVGPMLPGIYAFPFFDSSMEDDHVEENCTAQIEKAFEMYMPADEVAAMIIEPIQGDGGMLPAHPVFMNKLYDICRRHGILFITEEVQQAMGRTGKWFSVEHYGIVPDGMILGKSFGAGFPLGAFIGRAEIVDSLKAPAHGFTFAGNHVSCCAGAAAFDVMSEPGFFEEVTAKGEYIMESLRQLREKHGIIGDIRGIGMSIGAEIITGDGSPDANGTNLICRRSFDKGLVMISIGGNVLRVQPPLVITYEEIDAGLDIIDEVISEYLAGAIPEEILADCNSW